METLVRHDIIRESSREWKKKEEKKVNLLAGNLKKERNKRCVGPLRQESSAGWSTRTRRDILALAVPGIVPVKRETAWFMLSRHLPGKAVEI